MNFNKEPNRVDPQHSFLLLFWKTDIFESHICLAPENMRIAWNGLDTLVTETTIETIFLQFDILFNKCRHVCAHLWYTKTFDTKPYYKL